MHGWTAWRISCEPWEKRSNVAEASVIIEYLHLHSPGPVRLPPADPMVALEVRFLDRYFDLHLMSALQQGGYGALTGNPERRQEALTHATEQLERG